MSALGEIPHAVVLAADMTLRDHFAALAMQQLLMPAMSTDSAPVDAIAVCAESAYEVANAMLAARSA